MDSSPQRSTPAFVFDIDGVLTRGKHVLPQAIQAMKKLYHPHTNKPRMPFAFLTNGGGVTEETKAQQLTDWLNIPVTSNQVVLSHTPFKSIIPQYNGKPVLVIGRGDDLPDVAQSYGAMAEDIITVHDLVSVLHPAALPFQDQHHPNLPFTTSPSSASHLLASSPQYGSIDNPLGAIFVFNDPADWYVNLQLVIDVLVGGGVLGRRLEDVPRTVPQIDVYFSNPDLLWANEYPVPRFGQGAFASCVRTLYQQVTGKQLLYKSFGKPNREPYKLVEQILIDQAVDMGIIPSPCRTSRTHGDVLPFSAIYAIGDNAAADVRGATAAGHPWVSILVRTGVFQGGPGENCPIDPAHIVVQDINDAVDAALHHTRSIAWHSMR